jgi:hypothetical protein
LGFLWTYCKYLFLPIYYSSKNASQLSLLSNTFQHIFKFWKQENTNLPGNDPIFLDQNFSV